MADKKLGIIISAKADVKGDLKKVRKEFEKTGKTGAAAAKKTSKAWDKELKMLGKFAKTAGLAIGAALVGTAAYSIKVATDVEYGWAKVSTMLTSETMPALKGMKEELKDIAKLPTQESIAGMQEAIYQLLSASVETTDVMDMMGLSLKLASAGFTSTATAADAVTGVLNAYSLSIEHATDVADQLLLVQNRGKTTVGQYSQALGMVLPTAAKLGVGFNEIGAAIASMTRQNIPARQAITSLNAAMIAFITPGQQAIDIAEKYGVELSLAKMQEMGFLKFLQYINVGMGGNAELVAKATGQVEALKAVLALTGDQFNATQKDVEAFNTAQGTVTEGAKIMAATTKEQLGALRNEWTIFLDEVGGRFLPYVQDGVKVMGTLLDKTADQIEGNNAAWRRYVSEVHPIIGATNEMLAEMRQAMEDINALVIAIPGEKIRTIMPEIPMPPPAGAGVTAWEPSKEADLLGRLGLTEEARVQRDAWWAQDLQSAKDHELFLIETEQEAADKRKEITDKEAADRLNTMQEMFSGLNAMASGFTSLTSSLFQLRASGFNNEVVAINRSRSAENAKWAAYEKSARAAGKLDTATYKLRQKEHEASLASFAAAESSAKRKAFDVDKAGRLATITMQTAQAVMNAWATIPFPFSTIVAALAAGTGAAQFAMAAGQANPYHRGGMVFGGDDVPIMAQGGEFMIRRDMAQQTGEVLNAINEGRIKDAAQELGQQAGVSVGRPIAVNLSVGGKLSAEDFLMIRQQIDMSLVPALRHKQESGELDFLFEEDK